MFTFNPTLFFFYLLDLKPVLREIIQEETSGQKHNTLTFAPSTRYEKKPLRCAIAVLMIIIFYFNICFLVS